MNKPLTNAVEESLARLLSFGFAQQGKNVPLRIQVRAAELAIAREKK